jgi:hypothetical protein
MSLTLLDELLQSVRLSAPELGREITALLSQYDTLTLAQAVRTPESAPVPTFADESSDPRTSDATASEKDLYFATVGPIMIGVSDASPLISTFFDRTVRVVKPRNTVALACPWERRYLTCFRRGLEARTPRKTSEMQEHYGAKQEAA